MGSLRLCCNERTKNIVVASISMSLVAMAGAPAATVQNVALGESTDIDLTVGYYSEVVKMVMSIIAAAIFHSVYNLIGIKATAAIATVLVTGSYWPMIWIVNKYVIYLGAGISGIGLGSLWILWPMVVIDNSDEKIAQKNMGYWWMALSFGALIGGLCNYFYFNGVTEVSASNRVMVYAICAGITLLSSVIATVGVSNVKDRSKRHQPLKDEDRFITYFETDEIQDSAKAGVVDMKVLVEGKVEKDTELTAEEDVQVKAMDWFKVMMKRPEFWLLFVPLIYWGFIWGYFTKIMPTAAASISDKRNLIPLTTVINGAAILIGSATWNLVAKMTNNVFCIILSSSMLFGAIILSILSFPKGAAAEILDSNSIETYIKPDSIYIVVISALIGLADSGISIIFYTTAGRIYGEGTSIGFSVNSFGFCTFYIFSMFGPSLFDLHSYCYTLIASVFLMLLAFIVGLRKFI